MKTSQRLAYAERIERVLSHLEASDFDEESPSLDQMAAVAAMSPFHFHRIFRLMTGETPGAALRRVRLARSLPVLAGGEKVTAAGGASGYGSSQSFARVLRQEHGLSATRLKADPALLDQLAAELSHPGEVAADAPLAVTVTSLAPFRLLAVRNVGDYAELNTGYGRLFDLVLAMMPPEALQGIWGVPHDDPRFVPADECRFDCALSVGAEGQAAGELEEMMLGGGKFLRLRHVGDFDELHALIDHAYAAAIVLTDRAIGDGPLFIHYLDDPEEVAATELRSDIYLPLA